jgi:hypothetical protein
MFGLTGWIRVTAKERRIINRLGISLAASILLNIYLLFIAADIILRWF